MTGSHGHDRGTVAGRARALAGWLLDPSAAGWATVLRPLVVGVVGLAVVFALLAGNSFHLFLFSTFLAWGVLAISLNILFGYTGMLSLGHAGFMALGAYAYALLGTDLDWAPLPAALAAIALTAVAAAVIAVPTLRLRHHYLALATVAFTLIVYSLLGDLVELTGGPNGTVVPGFGMGDWRAGPEALFWICGIAFLATYLGVAVIARGRLGRAWVAIRDQEGAARSHGVDTYLTRLLVFIGTAALAALGGILLAVLNRYVTPENFSILISVQVLVAVLVGGAGTLIGPVLGAGFIVYAEELMRAAGDFDDLVFAVVLFVFVVFLPGGIAGAARNLFARRARPASSPPSGEGLDLTALRPEAAPEGSLWVRSLSKRFGGIQAVRGVDLEVRRGSVTALIGPNGAGKSTAFRLVTGMHRPDEGSWGIGETVELTGRPSHRIARFGVRQTFQTPALIGERSVLENVLVGFHWPPRPFIADYLPRSRRERRARAVAEELCVAIGLGDALHVPAGELSQGRQRLVEIARALVARPAFLLMDEPGAGLNLDEKEELREIIRAVADAGIGVLLVDHEMQLVMAVADYVVVLDQGRVIARGLPEEIRHDEVVIEAYLGEEVTGRAQDQGAAGGVRTG